MVKRIEKGQLVLFAYLMCVTVQILDTSQMRLVSGWHFVERGTTYIAIIGLFFLLFRRKVKRIWLITGFFFFTIGMIAALSNDRMTGTLILILFIINGINIKEEYHNTILRNYLIVASFLVAVTIMLSFVGVYYADYKIGRDGMARQYLGFLAATASPNYFFQIVIVYIAQKKKRLSILEFSIIFALNYWFYMMNGTRAVFYYVNVLLLLVWIAGKKPKLILNKVTTVALALNMPIGAIASLWLSINYNPSNRYMFILNTVLSKRLQLANFAIKKYGLSLFGTNAVWTTGRLGIERDADYLYVDSAYVNIAITYGIIILVVIVIGFTLMTIKSQIQNTYYFSISLLFLGIHSFSDPQLLELRHNPFLLFLFGTILFFSNRRYDKTASAIVTKETYS